jgi:hypothetical protein
MPCPPTSVPGLVQQVSVLMKAELNSNEIAFTTTNLNRAPWNRWSGSNRMAGLGIRLNLGVVLLGRDATAASIVANAFASIWALVVVQPAAGNGVQADGCFYEHGPFHMGGLYGAVYTADVLEYTALAAGTAYAITPAAAAVMGTLVLDGQQVRRWAAICVRVAVPTTFLVCLVCSCER